MPAKVFIVEALSCRAAIPAAQRAVESLARQRLVPLSNGFLVGPGKGFLEVPLALLQLLEAPGVEGPLQAKDDVGVPRVEAFERSVFEVSADAADDARKAARQLRPDGRLREVLDDLVGGFAQQRQSLEVGEALAAHATLKMRKLQCAFLD